MATNTITGIVKEIFVEEKYETKKGEFRKKRFWLEETNEAGYKTVFEFELYNDAIDKTAQYLQVDGYLEVSFNIRTRAWTKPTGEKIMFTTLNAWKLYDVSRRMNAQPQQAPANEMPQQADNGVVDEDALPF